MLLRFVLERLKHIAQIWWGPIIVLWLAGAALLVSFAILMISTALRLGTDTILGVTEQIKSSTADLAPFLTETVLIGIATMALLQSIRAIYPLRGLFQEWCVARWLWPGPKDPRWHVDRLLSLAVATNSRAVFDLPAEQLLAQIGAAADLVVSLPKRYEGLLFALVGKTGYEDAVSYLENFPRFMRAEEARPDFVDVRSRVAQHIQRRIDGLQISMGRQWRLVLRLTAIIVAALFAFAASRLPFPQKQTTGYSSRQFIPGGSSSRYAIAKDGYTPKPNSDSRGSGESQPSPIQSESDDATRPPLATDQRFSQPYDNENEFQRAPAKATNLQRGLFVALTGLVSGFMASLFRDVVAIIEKLRR